MVDAMPGCAWGWLRPSRAVASRAAQAGGLGKREAAEPAPCLSHQPGVHRCGINHLERGARPLLAFLPHRAPFALDVDEPEALARLAWIRDAVSRQRDL